MPAYLIVTKTQSEYNALINSTDVDVVAAKNDPLFVFVPATYSVEINGEFRDLASNSVRRAFRDRLHRDLRDPEKSIEQFATPLYKTMTQSRRDQARLDLAAVAPPGGLPIGPPAGVTGEMDAAQAAQKMLATGGGLALGYDHKDQKSKDFTTELIMKAGGTDLKHLFVEELSMDLQGEIDAFMADRAAVLPPNLLSRIKELQTGKFTADFEPMLYAAREKGVKIWGIDSSKADPQVDSHDPRYHERRLALMNAGAKTVMDQVRANHPGEPIMALTGHQHLNTAEGGVPGLAQILGVPGVAFDGESKRLAFMPEDTSKRAAVSPLQRECAEAISKKAGIDYKKFHNDYINSKAYTDLKDKERPRTEPYLNLLEITAAVQQVVAKFTLDGKLNTAADIAGLVTDKAVATALDPIFKRTVLRPDRRAKLKDAIQEGELPKVQSALDEDPYLAKMPADDEKKDTLLHAACGAGRPAIVQELVRRGVNANAIDLTGQAPIHKALEKVSDKEPASPEALSMVESLIAGHANVNLADPTGKTGLKIAQNDPRLVEKFVAGGATPATELFITKFVAEAKKRYVAANQEMGSRFAADEARQAATTLAGNLPGAGVPLANPGQVTTALTNRAVTAELDRLTKLFLARAARTKELVAGIKGKDLAKVQAALNADPRLAHIPIEGDHMALGLAAIAGDDAGMDELRNQRGVSIEQKNELGQTALHDLLSQDISKTNATGQQALTAKAQKLIARGADVNARDATGQTAMHIAGFRNNQSMITALKALTSPPAAAVPDLTARDDRGWTPLDTTLAATNKEAEKLLHPAAAGVAPPLKAGQLSTIDILCQATRCEDPADGAKARQFIERLYANADLRPILHLAAASACNPHNPPGGGLRLFASKGETVGPLYGRSPGATAAYDEKVDTLLFPMQDGDEGEAVGSLAHELTHFTAHLVTGNAETVPYSDNGEKAQYLAAIQQDVKKVHLLDDNDPVQKYIKNRFSGRMDTYKDKPGFGGPKTGPEFDESLLQEFIVGVPQVAAIYGMDELEKHMPGLVGYYKNVWTPKMNLTLASDPRLAAGRAKIDVAANGRATAALALNPNRQVKRVTPPMVKKDGASLDIDKLMTKIEADFVTDKGHPDVAKLNGRTILYKSADLELSQADRDDFEKKRSAIRSALKNALAGDNFPPEIESAEIQTLIKTITAAVKAHSGDDLKTALNNRAANWVKDAKTAYVDRAIEKRNVLTPQDLAEAIAYRAEARARAAGADVDLDPETEVKSSKQKDLIKGLAKTLSDPANADKLKKPAKLIDDISATLSNPAAQAVYMKAGATTHVSVDVKKAKSAWLLKLATM